MNINQGEVWIGKDDKIRWEINYVMNPEQVLATPLDGEVGFVGIVKMIDTNILDRMVQ